MRETKAQIHSDSSTERLRGKARFLIEERERAREREGGRTRTRTSCVGKRAIIAGIAPNFAAISPEWSPFLHARSFAPCPRGRAPLGPASMVAARVQKRLEKDLLHQLLRRRLEQAREHVHVRRGHLGCNEKSRECHGNMAATLSPSLCRCSPLVAPRVVAPSPRLD